MASSGKTLSRDYKHVRRQTPGASAFNAWTGLAAGLALGLTVALAVYLHYQNKVPAEPEPIADAPPASAQASEETTAPADTGPGYEFYDLLPKQEVEVANASVAANSPASKLPKGDVTLQAGSFKQVDEAERLHARLAQFGIDAKIQRFVLDDETWFRVRIGPIATVEELDVVRAKLVEAEVEATPVAPAVEVPLP